MILLEGPRNYCARKVDKISFPPLSGITICFGGGKLQGAIMGIRKDRFEGGTSLDREYVGGLEETQIRGQKGLITS